MNQRNERPDIAGYADAASRLAKCVAHDFHQLFATILTQTRIVAGRGRLDPADAEALHQVIYAAQRAVQLSEQLQSFGRKCSAGSEGEDLNGLIGRSLERLQAGIPSNVDVLFEPAEALPSLSASSALIDQVLQNLVRNAVEAMRPEGGQLRVSTHDVHVDAKHVVNHPEARVGHFVTLSVADTGCGMDLETSRKVFNPYFTTKGEGRGRGLGLSKVAAAAKLLCGWVEVSSQRGFGSTFTVFIPAGVTAATVSQPRQASPSQRNVTDLTLSVANRVVQNPTVTTGGARI